jgi:biopolymer transport protein ExbB
MRQLIALLSLGLLSAAAQAAWWNADWPQRSQLTLDTTSAQVDQPVQALPLAVRLHSGNFDFAAAKDDGSDLRVLAGDDKTPLGFRVERFDAVNELALIWVQLPQVAPGADKTKLFVYAGNQKAALEAGSGSGFDAATLAALHLGAVDGQDALGRLKSAAPLAVENAGLLGSAARLNGQALRFAAQDTVRVAAGGALTVSLWFKPESLANGVLLQQGALSLALQDGRLQARVGGVSLAGGTLAAGAWQHLALTLGQGQARLYLNGASVAEAAADTPALEGELRLGEGLNGLLDEVQLAAAVRSPAWLALSVATQGIEGRALKGVMESAESAGGGSEHGYMGILVKNLTTDAWAVIILCGLMFLVAVWVMVAKALLVAKADRANRSFLQRFRAAKHELLHLGGQEHGESSLYRLYSAGVRELNKRDIGTQPPAQAAAAAPTRNLSDASLNAVKAAVDADMVRESHKLNSQMVLLTIAISGGPFLGLLGTVVGVMITFAAIAAAGDVNVNAIAPGIAAALLATVAGLGVAIPALFGYNYLASRIKNISADMQIFVDEFITRVAEDYGR